jgi:DNA-binding CsgD family transcriptional regulator
MSGDVLASIYQGALDGTGWSDALRLAGDAISAQSAFMFSTHSDTQSDAVIHTHNQHREMVSGFGSYWKTHDVWALAARRSGHMRRGTLVLGEELVPREQLLKSAFYQEFCRHHGMEAMVGSVLFDGTEGDGMPFVNLCWYRPPGQPQFERSDRDRMQHLIAHFKRALRIQRRVGWATDRHAADALTALRIASIVLDRTGRVHHCNEAGEAFLQGLPAGSVRLGRLHGIGARTAPALQDALAACSAARPVRLLAVSAGTAPRVTRATLLWLGDLPVWEQRGHARKYLLLVELPRLLNDQRAADAAALFGLTAAETRVLQHLLGGTAPADIALASGTSLATVRSQMSSIFAKTGARTQVELLVLLGSV